MVYLEPAEYAAYGLSAETTDDWVTMASALVDGHCRRPGLALASYVERMRLTAGSQTVLLSYGPIDVATGITAVRVRYGRQRRGELGLQADPMLGQVAYVFGLPGTWSSLDVTTVDVNAGAREITFPVNFLGLNYNEAEVTYLAGFVTVPVAVKAACAQVVRNAQATPAMNVKKTKLDTMQMEYFSGSLLDAQVQILLRPYVAERLG